jgi:hypothetical protein
MSQWEGDWSIGVHVHISLNRSNTQEFAKSLHPSVGVGMSVWGLTDKV